MEGKIVARTTGAQRLRALQLAEEDPKKFKATGKTRQDKHRWKKQQKFLEDQTKEAL